MVHPQLDEVMEVNCDYVTATEKTLPSQSVLRRFGSFIVGEQAARGEQILDWKGSGYRGRHAGAASYGSRHDGAIVRLSGTAAADYWQQAVSLCTNVSRFDMQITVRPAEGNRHRLRKHYNSMRRGNHRKARPSTYKLWVGPSGPESLTVGSRASDFWLRIYDKGIESREAHYKGALRYELEVKRKPALWIALQLDQSEDPWGDMAARILRFVTERNLQVGWAWFVKQSANVSTLQLCASPRDLGSRVNRRVSWLAHSVRPAVQELVAAGRTDLVLTALGLLPQTLDHLVHVDQTVHLLESEEVN